MESVILEWEGKQHIYNVIHCYVILAKDWKLKQPRRELKSRCRIMCIVCDDLWANACFNFFILLKFSKYRKWLIQYFPHHCDCQYSPKSNVYLGHKLRGCFMHKVSPFNCNYISLFFYVSTHQSASGVCW